MPRINLLSEGRRPVAAREQKEPRFVGGDEDRLGRIWLFGLVLLGLLVAGGYWFYLNHTIKGLDHDIAEAQEEIDELAPIIREVEQYKAQKAELEHKINVINQLKANQRGPVRIMDQVSQALPELLWLTRMQVQGNRVTLQGQAFNTNAVAAFIDNLDQVPEFQEPVLKETSRRAEIYNFNLEYTFNIEPAETTTTAAAPASDEAAGDEMTDDETVAGGAESVEEGENGS